MDYAYYLFTEDNELHKAAQKFRNDVLAYNDNITAYLEPYNVSKFLISFDGYPVSFVFKDGKVPEGFKKADKNGGRQPYAKNKEWQDIIKNAPRQPNADDYLHDIIKIPHCISYKSENCTGSTRIGGFSLNLYQLGWYSEDSLIVLVMTDVKAEINNFYQNRSEQGEVVEITNDIESWELPSGLERILKEKWDLMVAEHAEGK